MLYLKNQGNFQYLLLVLLMINFCVKTFATFDVIFNLLTGGGETETEDEEKRAASNREDAALTTDEIIQKYGYPSEVHFVTTEDGYVLQMHRIAKPKAQPYLLMHGYQDSSAGYTLMGPNRSLGFLLYNRGYDVWLGNARGNRYSRNHTSLDPDEKEFWQFSWHEIGIYDLPAMIDYILNKTGYNKLYYTGHSQVITFEEFEKCLHAFLTIDNIGTTAFFVMNAKKPHYNSKIILMQAFSPAVYLKRHKGPLTQLIASSFNTLEILADIFALYEYPNGKNYGSSSCLELSLSQDFCQIFMFLLQGPTERIFDDKISVLHSHFPAGASVKQLWHYSQITRSGSFHQFDYGPSKNMEMYGQTEPPAYDLSKVTAPVVLYYSLNDYFCDPADVERLYHELPNCVGKYVISKKEFNHMDFLYSVNIWKLLYKRFFQVLKDFEAGKLKVVIE